MNGLLKLANIPVEESHTGVIVTAEHVTVVDLEPRGEGYILSGFGKSVFDKPRKTQTGLAVAAIKSICRKNSLRAKTVCALAPSADTLIRRRRMPPMARQEIIDSARFSERESSPFPLDTASIDAWVEHDEKKSESRSALIAALDASGADRLKKLFRRTELKLTAISIVPAALAALVSKSKTIDRSRPVPIINIEKSSIGIYIFIDGQVNFIREINIGSGELRENVTAGITRETALSKTDPFLNKLVNEIDRSFEHFKNRQRVNQIEPVLIVGCAADLKNIAAHLTASTEYDFRIYNPFDDFLTVDNDSLKYAVEMGPEIAVPLGLAIDRGNTINLLPEKFRYSFDKFKGRAAPLAIAAVYLFFLLWLKFTNVQVLENVQRHVNGAKQIALGLEKEEQATLLLVNEIFKVKSEIKSVEKRIRFYPELKGSNVDWRAVYMEIASHLPDNAALDKITISFNNPQESAADGKLYRKQILINGKIRGTPDKKLKLLRTFLEKMQSSSRFEHTSLISTKQSGATGGSSTGESSTSESSSMLLFTLAVDMRSTQ